MVDELELLKKDWQKQEDTLPKYTKEDLYPMLLKKSSSIVKWILIISIIEFAFWIALSIILEQTNKYSEFKINDDLQIYNIGLNVINYIALIYFISRFYLNYKLIKTNDSARGLMRNILKVRKTVKQYILFNVIFLVVGTIVMLGVKFKSDPQSISEINPFMFFIAFIIILGLFIGLLLILYRLVYGRLTKRLKSNYEQLKTHNY